MDYANLDKCKSWIKAMSNRNLEKFIVNHIGEQVDVFIKIGGQTFCSEKVKERVIELNDPLVTFGLKTAEERHAK